MKSNNWDLGMGAFILALVIILIFSIAAHRSNKLGAGLFLQNESEREVWSRAYAAQIASGDFIDDAPMNADKAVLNFRKRNQPE